MTDRSPEAGETSRVLDGGDFRLRRAGIDDVAFLVELAGDAEVEPFLAASRARDPEAIRQEVEQSLADPADFGRFVIEVPRGADWDRVGAFGFEVQNRRSRIANLGGLALLPAARGRGLADAAARLFQLHLIFDLGYHRLQLECYGFNERAIRHAERAGFVREGVKRKAYRREGEWVDGVLFGLVREDLEAGEHEG